MITEELKQSVQQLEKDYIGVKTEVLDIKEVLADYDDRIINSEKQIEQSQFDFKQMLNNKTSQLVSNNELTDLYYNKSEIDSKFDELDYMNKNDVRDYLLTHDYITSNDIRGFVTTNNLSKYFDVYLEEYPTFETCNKTYVSKEELELLTGNNIDLSIYAKKTDLDNYYTKGEVEKLIPSTSNLVKISQLYSEKCC